MRSILIAGLCLSLAQHSVARIPHSFKQLAERDNEPEAQSFNVLTWLSQLVKRNVQPRQTTCYEDAYYNFVSDSEFGETFCNAYMQYPNTTQTVEYTPAV